MINNKKHDKQMADALNDCLERMLVEDLPIDVCLTRYQQHSAELKPLLETIIATHKVSKILPDPSFRARARYEFHSALHDNIAPKHPLIAWRWGWANIASTIGVLLLTSTGGVVAASSNSMPGQPLYQVKRTFESVQLTLAPSQSAKARLYATFADHRVGEIVYAAKSGNVMLTEDLTRQFSEDLNMLSAIAAPTRTLTFGSGAKQGESAATSGLLPEQSNVTVDAIQQANDNKGAIAAAPSLSTTPPQSPEASITPVPTTVSGSISSPTSLTSIQDPVLLKIVQQYSAKNTAELSSILDKVPASAKAALLESIQVVTSGYGNILAE